MRSKLYLEEEVDNKDRKFGSALKYQPVLLVDEDGNEIPALFTEDQIATAVQRALRNPEDIPKGKSIWDIIFG